MQDFFYNPFLFFSTLPGKRHHGNYFNNVTILGFHPGEKFYQRDISGKRNCQRGPPVTGSASLVVVKLEQSTLFLLFPGGKWSKLFPGKNFKVHPVTWPGCNNASFDKWEGRDKDSFLTKKDGGARTFQMKKLMGKDFFGYEPSQPSPASMNFAPSFTVYP